MARQTRRRRDSKVKSRFKHRPTPSISRASSADIEKVGTAKEFNEKIRFFESFIKENWKSI